MRWRFGLEQPNHANRLELATREIQLRNRNKEEIDGEKLLEIMKQHDDDFSKTGTKARKHLRNRVITPLRELGILEKVVKNTGPEGLLSKLSISSYYLNKKNRQYE